MLLDVDLIMAPYDYDFIPIKVRTKVNYLFVYVVKFDLFSQGRV